MRVSLTWNGEARVIPVERTADGVAVQLEGETLHVHSATYERPRLTFVLGDKLYTARVMSEGRRRWIHLDGITTVVEKGEVAPGRAAVAREGAGAGLVTAPMPGQVRGVLVGEGDWVRAGQPLLLLEAMKLEIRVSAPRAGVVIALRVKPGDSVEREQVLAELRPEGEETE